MPLQRPISLLPACDADGNLLQVKDRSTSTWVHDGSPFDRAATSAVRDDLCFDLPTGADESCLVSGLVTMPFVQA
jgi:hypothetical protein